MGSSPFLPQRQPMIIANSSSIACDLSARPSRRRRGDSTGHPTPRRSQPECQRHVDTPGGWSSRKQQRPKRTTLLQQKQRVLTCLAEESAHVSHGPIAFQNGLRAVPTCHPVHPEAAGRRAAHNTGAEVPRRRGVFRLHFRNGRATSAEQSMHSLAKGTGTRRGPASRVTPRTRRSGRRRCRCPTRSHPARCAAPHRPRNAEDAPPATIGGAWHRQPSERPMP